MAEKSRVFRTNIAGGGTSNKDFPPLPNGRTWRLRRFGAIDINNGDNISSIYILRWGSPGSFQDVRAISLSGNTYEYELQKDFLGDGTKFFRVICRNMSTSAKDLIFWIEAHSRRE